MNEGVEPPDAEQSIGDLVQQLVADARDYVEAEINLYKEIAFQRADNAKSGFMLVAAGGSIALAGFIAFLVGLVLGLARWIGPVAAGIAVMAAAGLAGFLLVRAGAARLRPVDAIDEPLP